MLDWLKSQPDLYERLKQIRSLQSSDPDLDRAELELLELTQAIGASSSVIRKITLRHAQAMREA